MLFLHSRWVQFYVVLLSGCFLVNNSVLAQKIDRSTDTQLQRQAAQRWQEQKEKSSLLRAERTSSSWRNTEKKKEHTIEHKIEDEIEHQALKKEQCKPVAVMPIFFTGLICGVIVTGLVSVVLGNLLLRCVCVLLNDTLISQALYSDGIVGYGVAEPSSRSGQHGGSYQTIPVPNKETKEMKTVGAS